MLLGAGSAATGIADLMVEAFIAGAIYRPLSKIRAVSLDIAVAVAEQAYAEGLASLPAPEDLPRTIAAQMYDPTYDQGDGV